MRAGFVLLLALAWGCEADDLDPVSDTGGVATREFRPGGPNADGGDTEPFPATDCTIPVNPACNLYAHPDTNCKEKENRDGPGVVQSIKGMHCTITPLCPTGPGDVDVERICLPGMGAGHVTSCGAVTGPAGCAVCWAEAECY